MDGKNESSIRIDDFELRGCVGDERQVPLAHVQPSNMERTLSETMADITSLDSKFQYSESQNDILCIASELSGLAANADGAGNISMHTYASKESDHSVVPSEDHINEKTFTTLHSFTPSKSLVLTNRPRNLRIRSGKLVYSTSPVSDYSPPESPSPPRSKGRSRSQNVPPTDELEYIANNEKLDTYQRRRLKNNISCRKSRAKKKILMESISRDSDGLRKENSELKMRVNWLEEVNAELRAMLVKVMTDRDNVDHGSLLTKLKNEMST